MPNFLGWLIGVFLGLILMLAIFIALGVALPATVGFLAAAVATVTAVVGTISPQLAIGMAIFFIGFFYIWAYALATASVSASLPVVTLPLTTEVPVPGGVPTALPNIPGELFARGMMIGLTAILNASLLSLIPLVGPVLGLWAFAIISFAAVILVARNLIFQGFLGWSAWLFPMSYFATVVGLLLFIVNYIPAVTSPLGFGAVRIDWTTGVIETAGGLTGITGFNGGFSLGNFTFLTPGTAQGSFTASNVNSHETGHSLNTAAFGGLVLWINAIDQNVPPFRRLNIAYGELTTESHTQGMTGPLRVEFFVRIWG